MKGLSKGQVGVAVMGGMWVFFAFLQFNDGSQYGNQDNEFWIFYYLLAGVLTFWHAFQALPRWSLTAVAGFSIGAALFRLQDEVGNFNFQAIFQATAVPSQMNAAIQQPNECGGLLVVALWFVFLAFGAALVRGRFGRFFAR